MSLILRSTKRCNIAEWELAPLRCKWPYIIIRIHMTPILDCDRCREIRGKCLPPCYWEDPSLE